MQDYPFIRQLRRPLTPEQLRPLDPRCQTVQFGEELAEPDLLRVAEFLTAYPQVVLRAYGHSTYTTLDFLRCFPSVRQVQIDIFGLTDISGFGHLSPELTFLGFGQTRRGFSLSWLERFPRLEDVWLEGHAKDIAVLSHIASLRRVSLRSITLPNLELLRPLEHLETVEVKLGGTKDLRGLESLSRLRYFEAFQVRGLSDLTPLAACVALEQLLLQALTHVTALPSFRKHDRLRRVHLDTMKGLSDLSSVADAPALEELLIVAMSHLQPEALRPFVGHPTLRRATVGLGSLRKNSAVHSMLGLPAVDGRATTPDQLTA